MRIVRNLPCESENCRGAVAAIGNFDGVHLGHQAILEIAARNAASRSAPLGVVTFEPHPRQFFDASASPFRLTSSAARARKLESLGVDLLFELEFNGRLSGLDPHRFSQSILADGLGISSAVVGEDFRYGKGRAGNATTLADDGDRCGFGVEVVPMAADTAGVYSSTAIRGALSDGRTEDAARMLGSWHRIEGTVVRGAQRGRELGFPTVNIALGDLHPPRYGVYAVRADVLTGELKGNYRGSASVGVRPTFGRNEPNLEAFLFDFSGDVYGELVSVELVSYQREELRFDCAGDLIRQMHEDCRMSMSILDKIIN